MAQQNKKRGSGSLFFLAASFKTVKFFYRKSKVLIEGWANCARKVLKQIIYKK